MEVGRRGTAALRAGGASRPAAAECGAAAVTSEVESLRAALDERYTFERELGRGGMATVYLAQDLKHHRKVAIKVLEPEIAAALGPERFLREIEIAAGLNHPHILPLYDSGEAATSLYYVMPYLEGETLRSEERRVGKERRSGWGRRRCE